MLDLDDLEAVLREERERRGRYRLADDIDDLPPDEKVARWREYCRRGRETNGDARADALEAVADLTDDEKRDLFDEIRPNPDDWHDRD